MEFYLRKVEKQDWDFIWALRVETMKEKIVNSYGWDEMIQRSYAEESFNWTLDNKKNCVSVNFTLTQFRK